VTFRRYISVSSPLPEAVSAEEISARWNLSLPKVYEMARRGEIPCFRFGRSVRFLVDDVMAALAANKQGGTE